MSSKVFLFLGLFVCCLTPWPAQAEEYILRLWQTNPTGKPVQGSCPVEHALCAGTMDLPILDHWGQDRKNPLTVHFKVVHGFITLGFSYEGNPLSTTVQGTSGFSGFFEDLNRGEQPVELYLQHPGFTQDNPTFAIVRPPNMKLANIIMVFGRTP